jgi:hypothetical protein
MTIPKHIPHAITARKSFDEYKEMGDGPDPPTFSHIVLVLKEAHEVLQFVESISSGGNSTTSLILISDLVQRREIVQQGSEHDIERLIKDRRLRFIFKPLKPSKFAVIFDPQKEREVSTDRNQDSAQQVADKLAGVNAELMSRLGGKGHRVLLVEDNRINQMVSNRCNWRQITVIADKFRFSLSCSRKPRSILIRSSMVYSVPRRSLLIPMTTTPLFWYVFVPSKIPTSSHTHFLLVRSSHAEQRRLPDLQRHPRLGSQTSLPSDPYDRSIR